MGYLACTSDIVVDAAGRALTPISEAICLLAEHAVARLPSLAQLVVLIGHSDSQNAGHRHPAFVTSCTNCLTLCYYFVHQKIGKCPGYFCGSLAFSDVAY